MAVSFHRVADNYFFRSWLLMDITLYVSRSPWSPINGTIIFFSPAFSLFSSTLASLSCSSSTGSQLLFSAPGASPDAVALRRRSFVRLSTPSSAFYDRRSSRSRCTDASPASLYRSSRCPEAPRHDALLILLFANLVRRSSLTTLRSLVVLTNRHREVTSDPCVPSSCRLRRSIFYPRFEGRRTVQFIYTLHLIIYV
jgi:hypothetical protein